MSLSALIFGSSTEKSSHVMGSSALQARLTSIDGFQNAIS
jgi:hypothetical protein